MDLEHLAARSLRWLNNAGNGSNAANVLPDVFVLRSAEPTPLTATVYEPVMCLILQGSKEVLLGDAVFRLGPGDVLLVSHHVPVNSRITSARPGEPYLAVILSLDVSLLRSLYGEAGRATGDADLAGSSTPAIASITPGQQLVDALARYLALAENELDAKILASSVRREIHFRLLMAPSGGTLRSLLRHGGHASRVARAIARIRAGFRQPIAVPELARDVGMSSSSLHKHFRAITSTTPLQFQKELRLLEARRLLITGQNAVSDVAYEVGYESPNQFSREYSRKFGTSPRADQRATQTASPD